MGKPRAQIKKEYREREKRQEGEAFMEKEKKSKKYYVKTSYLTVKRKTNTESQREREWKSSERLNKRIKGPQEINERMIVAMNFSNESKKLNAKKESTDRFQNVNTEIDALKQENLKIERKNEALRKKLMWSKSHV